MTSDAPWVSLLLLLGGCAGGVGADRPDWPPPATLSGDGDEGARVDGDGDAAPADTDTDTDEDPVGTDGGLGGTTTGDPSATTDDGAADGSSSPPDLGVPEAGTGGSGEGVVPPTCASGSGECGRCADLACCAAIEEATADPEASCVSACMLEGNQLPACGSSCDTVDPFSEPGITDLFVCLSDECAGVCGSV